jgi:hypothetical protein
MPAILRSFSFVWERRRDDTRRRFSLFDRCAVVFHSASSYIFFRDNNTISTGNRDAAPSQHGTRLWFSVSHLALFVPRELCNFQSAKKHHLSFVFHLNSGHSRFTASINPRRTKLNLSVVGSSSFRKWVKHAVLVPVSIRDAN